MIDADYARTMARYNAWQNRSLYREADRLGDSARHEDRGAFFGSIHGTLTHLLWADLMWMARLDGWERPDFGPADGASRDWPTLGAERVRGDRGLSERAARLSDADLGGSLEWYSGLQERTVSKPVWILVTHLFNHQTHHRGQAHALLTGAGATPEPSDLAFMPEDA